MFGKYNLTIGSFNFLQLHSSSVLVHSITLQLTAAPVMVLL